jgi:hypothetical protein
MANSIYAATVFLLFLVVLSLGTETVAAQTPGGVQTNTVIKRNDLTDEPGAFNAEQVNWGFWVKDKKGAECSLTTDGTNTNEIMIHLSDGGGLSGDPECELGLDFESLKNSFVFTGVTITAFNCGNAPCAATVLRGGRAGSKSLHVTVSGKMKGVLVGTSNSFFRVTPTLRGPAGFNPFLEQAKPDLVVAKIDKTSSLGSPGSSGVVVTLANLGDADWMGRQSFAYSSDANRAVLISLRKDNVVCGSSSLTLIQFDADRGLNRVNQPVTFTWPGCSFSGTANITATVDVNNRLFEREETSGKSKTVELRSSLVNRPR